MQSEIEKKIKSFTKIVLEDISEKNETEKKKVQSEIKSSINNQETEFLSEAYENIQKEIRKIRKTDNENVLHAEVEARRQLLMTREDIINQVFCDVKKRLTDFMNSDEYENWLLKSVNKAYSELGDGKKNVVLSPNDAKFEDKIKSDNTSVEYDNSSVVKGGAKVFNLDKKIAVDYTFDTMLEAHKNEFLQKGDLAIS